MNYITADEFKEAHHLLFKYAMQVKDTLEGNNHHAEVERLLKSQYDHLSAACDEITSARAAGQQGDMLAEQYHLAGE